MYSDEKAEISTSTFSFVTRENHEYRRNSRYISIAHPPWQYKQTPCSISCRIK